MNKFISSFTTIVTFCLLSMPVFAGTPTIVAGTITFTGATPIPTLSGMMLMMLALLLATIAYRVLKQKGNNRSRMMVLSLIGVGALASGFSGVNLINDAYAASSSQGVDLGGPGQHTLYSGYTIIFTNEAGEDLTVSAITGEPLYFCGGTGGHVVPVCDVNVVVTPGSSCGLYCYPDS